MEDPTLNRIWSRIIDELAYHQDRAPIAVQGHVINPINESVYARDTGFAAQVFATEYRRTQDEKWLQRAQSALRALEKMHVYDGLDEPIWDRYGWHLNKGSLAATGILLDVVWEAQNLLGVEYDDEENWHRLSRYLAGCRVGPGLFAHDTVISGSKPPCVQNTTAIVLYLLECMAKRAGTSSVPILRERSLIYSALEKGQRADGFWPYIYPGTVQQVYFRYPVVRRFVKHLPVVRGYFHRGGDASVYFGDMIHHCMVLYYLSKSVLLSGSGRDYDSVLRKGWQWIYRHLQRTPDGSLMLDFDWEPRPYGPRYCNFRETTSLFLILATLPVLAQMGVVDDEYRGIIRQLLTYIQNNLLEKEGTYPGIKPHEGPIEILRNILPHVSESVAWKGRCLSTVLLAENTP